MVCNCLRHLVDSIRFPNLNSRVSRASCILSLLVCPGALFVVEFVVLLLLISSQRMFRYTLTTRYMQIHTAQSCIAAIIIIIIIVRRLCAYKTVFLSRHTRHSVVPFAKYTDAAANRLGHAHKFSHSFDFLRALSLLLSLCGCRRRQCLRVWTQLYRIIYAAWKSLKVKMSCSQRNTSCESSHR